MPTPLNNAAIFLITTLFDLYLMILMLRLILCWNRANYFNPITQVIINLTQPLVSPLRKILPTYRGIEFATLAIIFILQIIKISLIGIMTLGMPHIMGLLLVVAVITLKLLLNTLFYAILLQAIFSWFPQSYSALMQFLMQITSPIMRPLQRRVPLVGQFDISPIIALILIQLLIILFIDPLFAFGMGISFGYFS